MDENKFWVSVWGIIAVVVLALITSITTYNVTLINSKIALVKGGADPLAVRCMERSVEDAVCVVYVTKK